MNKSPIIELVSIFENPKNRFLDKIPIKGYKIKFLCLTKDSLRIITDIYADWDPYREKSYYAFNASILKIVEDLNKNLATLAKPDRNIGLKFQSYEKISLTLSIDTFVNVNANELFTEYFKLLGIDCNINITKPDTDLEIMYLHHYRNPFSGNPDHFKKEIYDESLIDIETYQYLLVYKPSAIEKLYRIQESPDVGARNNGGTILTLLDKIAPSIIKEPDRFDPTTCKESSLKITNINFSDSQIAFMKRFMITYITGYLTKIAESVNYIYDLENVVDPLNNYRPITIQHKITEQNRLKRENAAEHILVKQKIEMWESDARRKTSVPKSEPLERLSIRDYTINFFYLDNNAFIINTELCLNWTGLDINAYLKEVSYLIERKNDHLNKILNLENSKMLGFNLGIYKKDLTWVEITLTINNPENNSHMNHIILKEYSNLCGINLTKEANENLLKTNILGITYLQNSNHTLTISKDNELIGIYSWQYNTDDPKMILTADSRSLYKNDKMIRELLYVIIPQISEDYAKKEQKIYTKDGNFSTLSTEIIRSYSVNITPRIKNSFGEYSALIRNNFVQKIQASLKFKERSDLQKK